MDRRRYGDNRDNRERRSYDREGGFRRRDGYNNYRERDNYNNNNTVMDGRKLFIVGFSERINQNDLRDLFSRYGEVEDMKMIEDQAGKRKGYAFVNMKRDEDGRAAQRELHKHKLEIDGSEIHVEFARGKDRAREPNNNDRRYDTRTSDRKRQKTSHKPTHYDKYREREERIEDRDSSSPSPYRRRDDDDDHEKHMDVDKPPARPELLEQKPSPVLSPKSDDRDDHMGSDNEKLKASTARPKSPEPKEPEKPVVTDKPNEENDRNHNLDNAHDRYYNYPYDDYYARYRRYPDYPYEHGYDYYARPARDPAHNSPPVQAQPNALHGEANAENNKPKEEERIERDFRDPYRYNNYYPRPMALPFFGYFPHPDEYYDMYYYYRLDRVGRDFYYPANHGYPEMHRRPAKDPRENAEKTGDPEEKANPPKSPIRSDKNGVPNAVPTLPAALTTLPANAVDPKKSEQTTSQPNLRKSPPRKFKLIRN